MAGKDLCQIENSLLIDKFGEFAMIKRVAVPLCLQARQRARRPRACASSARTVTNPVSRVRTAITSALHLLPKLGFFFYINYLISMS